MFTNNTETGILTLKYDVDYLYKNILGLILYKADRYRIDNNQDTKEDLSLTEDDKALFYKMLRDSFDNVFSEVSVYGKYVELPYQFNVQEGENYYVIITLKMPDEWGIHMAGVLDNKIKESIELGVIKRWFDHLMLYDLSSMINKELEDQIREVRSSLFYRNTPIKKKYHTLY